MYWLIFLCIPATQSHVHGITGCFQDHVRHEMYAVCTCCMLVHVRSWGFDSEQGSLSTEIVSPQNVRSYTYEVWPTRLPKHELNKDSNNHAEVDGQELTRHQPYWCHYRELRDTENGRNSLPGESMNGRNSLPWEEHANGLHSIKWSSLTTFIQLTLTSLSRLYLFI